MITAKQIRRGIARGAVRFIVDPNMGAGTVCAIGDNWFYFGGETAEQESPKEYLEHVPIEDIVGDIMNVLNDFCLQPETFGDEYAYYESILKKSEENMQTDFERGYQKALEEINMPMNVIIPKWNSSKCPRCQKDFSDYEPCNDGYYDRANTMERCPFCGQKLNWKRN